MGRKVEMMASYNWRKRRGDQYHECRYTKTVTVQVRPTPWDEWRFSVGTGPHDTSLLRASGSASSLAEAKHRALMFAEMINALLVADDPSQS
jgi:hypothetical protein